MSSWIVTCAEKDRGAVGRLVRSLDAAARVRFAEASDVLRRLVSGSDPGSLEVVVGPVGTGVSDINLAAAVANDGSARRVVLAVRGVSGSLRSRAARAGIDLVFDLDEFDEGSARDERPGKGAKTAAPFDSGSSSEGPAPSGRGAPVVVLCSGRGGVGKTALAVGASVTAARWGLRVCLLDLDLSCGNAYSCFGLGSGGDLSTLGPGPISAEALSRACVSAAPGVSLAGPCARPETAELVAPRAAELIERAAREFDLVVVDTSPTFTDAVALAAQRADRLVIVSDGRQGSLSSVARVSGLAVRLGVARTRIARLENRVDPRERPDPVAGRAEVGLEAARGYRVVDGGREVADYLASGRAVELCEPGYPFSDSLAAALAQLMAELGRLPECEEARRAAETPRRERRWSIFGARREAR